MFRRSNVVSLVLILALVAAAGGCKKKAVETAPEPAAEDARPTPAPPPPQKEVKDDFPSQEPFGTKDQEPTDIHELNRLGVLRTVYFAFDSSELSPSAQSTLRDNAQWLKAHPNYRFVIQGHCDERGTIEYNLALGDRRGSAARDYLVSLGIERSRARVVTFGEERPAIQGHDESAWSQNRRAEFLLEE
jgi:peptidoglycan-associated lipoprotein